MFRQRNMQRIVILVLSVFVWSSLYANEEFKQWLKQEKGSFQEYKDKRDKEFTAFLKTQWKGVELLKGFKRDTKPKPVVMPVARPQPMPIPGPQPAKKPRPVVDTKPAIPVLPVIKPELPLEPSVPVTVSPRGIKITVNYFGSQLVFYYDQKLKAPFSGRISEKSVSGFWSALSLADYDALIEQIDAKSRALKLNDWSYALLVNDISKKIYPATSSNQSLFTWFIMAKAGYRARIAYDSRNVFLLIPSLQQLYSVPYFTFDKVRYYAVRFDGKKQNLGQVYTYDGNYPDADKALDMRLVSEVTTKSRLEQRDLSFEFEGKKYIIKAVYDRERVNYMDTYPQLDLKWYFRSRVGATMATTLQNQLRDSIKGMDEQRAVNFLLRFVQTSLKYKTDEKQFGKENYLFPEETLHYPYSDCEDRAILFAWLVQTLLELEVVGLNFPGHVATAVKFNSRVSGDAITYKGNRYIVSDPTYINASAGMTMPDYKNIKPDVIAIR